MPFSTNTKHFRLQHRKLEKNSKIETEGNSGYDIAPKIFLQQVNLSWLQMQTWTDTKADKNDIIVDF